MKMLHTFKLTFIVLLFFHALVTKATETRDSVDTYTNQTVSTTVTVQGRDTLHVSNVTVISPGNLTLAAPNDITITGPFNVELGGQLNAYVQTRPLIWYTYDTAGNRIRRELKQVKNAIR